MGILDKKKDDQAQKSKKKISMDYILIFILIAIIGLLYFSSFFSQMTFLNVADTSAENVENVSVSQTSQMDLEEKLKSVLSKIEGAGEVDVMITYESSAEIVPVVSVDQTTSTTNSSSGSSSSTSQTNTTSTKPVTVDNGSSGSVLVLVEKEPVVKGVIVVAQGAGDIKTKLALQRAVQTVLDIDSTNIDIFTMKK